MRAILLCLLALTACKKEAMTPAVCENEAHRFGNWLKALPRPTKLEPMIPVPLVDGETEPLAPAVEDAHQILIDKRSVSLRGDVLAEAGGSLDGFADDLADALNTRNEMLRAMGEVPPVEIAVAASNDAPWSLVAPTLTALGAVGQRNVVLVFEKKGGIRPPPKSKISAKLDKIIAEGDPSMKATQLAALVTDLIKDCPAAQRRFGEVAMMEPDSKVEFLRLEIPKAFVECQCRVDLEAAQTAFHALVAPRIAVGVRSIGIADPASHFAHEKVAFPAATPWSEAHKRIVEIDTEQGIPMLFQVQ